MIDLEGLVSRFDAVLRPVLPPPPPPTASSLQRIEGHFGFVLPQELIWLSRNAKNFGSWFASLGPDHESETHIIRINSHWRQRRRERQLPRHLVAFNLGFDEDLDCFDLGSGDAKSYPIVCWSPGASDCNVHPSFGAYIESCVDAWRTG